MITPIRHLGWDQQAFWKMKTTELRYAGSFGVHQGRDGVKGHCALDGNMHRITDIEWGWCDEFQTQIKDLLLQ